MVHDSGAAASRKQHAAVQEGEKEKVIKKERSYDSICSCLTVFRSFSASSELNSVNRTAKRMNRNLSREKKTTVASSLERLRLRYEYVCLLWLGLLGSWTHAYKHSQKMKHALGGCTVGCRWPVNASYLHPLGYPVAPVGAGVHFICVGLAGLSASFTHASNSHFPRAGEV